MKKKALLAMLLAVTLLMSSCGLVVKHDDVDQKRAIITLDGEVQYTKAEVQSQVNYYLSYMSYYYSMFGYSFDTTSADNISDAQDAVIEGLQQEAIINREAASLGLTLTDEESAAGTTLEDKLEDAVTADITVTDEELETELASKVESDKTTFESTPNTYGTRVNNGTAVYYRPAGYRMVRNLLIQYEEADLRLTTALRTNVSSQTSAASTASTAVTGATATDLEELTFYVTVTVTEAAEQATTMTDLGETIVVPTYTATTEDTFPATEDEDTLTLYENVKAYAMAQALQAKYQEALDAASAAGLANIQEKTDAAMARLDAGEDFVTVMTELTDDPGMTTKPDGYAVREGFTSFDTPFVTAAMSLANVGDYSQPTAGMYGYYIVQYASEVTEGAVDLSEVRDTLYDSLLADKKDEAFDAQLEQWIADAKWVINKDALND